MEGPYLRELERQGFGLRFRNRRIESEYQTQAAGRHSRDLRMQLLIGALMICSVCLLDFVLLEHDVAMRAIMLRLGVMLPPMLLMMLLTLRSSHRHYLQPAGVLVGLAVGIGSLLIGTDAGGIALSQLFGGYPIIIIFVYFFLGLRVPIAIATATLLYLAFVATLLVMRAPTAEIVYNAVFLLFLNVIGALGSLQLSKARRAVFLEERILKYRANHDSLTALPNRRAFDSLLASAWESAKALQKPIAIMMIDIDHFKDYNDRYGHQAGDRAIASVAGILGRNLQRPQDFAGRYGGEEFVVLLFDCNRGFARRLAEQIREQVLEVGIEHLGSSAAKAVTVSAGIAWIEPYLGQRSLDGFVQTADESLYAAKQMGRNCVIENADRQGSSRTGVFRVAQLDEVVARG